MTEIYRGPANSKCNINVEQHQCTFISVILHIFDINDCHLLFFENLVGKRKDEVEFRIIPLTNEESISIRCGCGRFNDNL